MTQYCTIHPDNPQLRLIKQITHSLASGGVIILPTDTCYVLACQMGDHQANDRIRAIRRLDEAHLFTLLCQDLSDLGTYAKVDNPTYKLLKSMIPGSFTFILSASREVPKRLWHVKRKTVGLRVSADPVCRAILSEFRQPLLISTLKLPQQDLPLTDPEEMKNMLDGRVDWIINAGMGSCEMTTVIDLTLTPPSVIREGKGRL